MTITEMVSRYDAKSAAHAYILGFVHAHQLYAVRCTLDELAPYFKLSRMSSAKGGKAQVRIRMSSAQRAELAQTAELFGSEDLLLKDATYNKGDNFEREVVERWTTERWAKNSTPFWIAGDVEIDGIQIQVKLDNAELTNEKVLEKIGA